MIKEINKMLEKAHEVASLSGGEYEELKKSEKLLREATKMSLELTKTEPDNLIGWQLLYGNLHQSGAWNNDWGNWEEKQLEVVNQLIRLNPEDDDSKYEESFYDADYAYEGGLYFFLFKHLKSVYKSFDDKNWGESKEGKMAKEALIKACKLHPDSAHFIKEEAQYSGIILE